MCHGSFSLMDCLDELEDPRDASNGTLYDFRKMLVIAICASLCDMDTCEDFSFWAEARQPWLKRFLTLKHGIPSSATFFRLFRALDPKQFEAFFRHWVSQIVPAATSPGRLRLMARRFAARPMGHADQRTLSVRFPPIWVLSLVRIVSSRRATKSRLFRNYSKPCM